MTGAVDELDVDAVLAEAARNPRYRMSIDLTDVEAALLRVLVRDVSRATDPRAPLAAGLGERLGRSWEATYGSDPVPDP